MREDYRDQKDRVLTIVRDPENEAFHVVFAGNTSPVESEVKFYIEGSGDRSMLSLYIDHQLHHMFVADAISAEFSSDLSGEVSAFSRDVLWLNRYRRDRGIRFELEFASDLAHDPVNAVGLVIEVHDGVLRIHGDAWDVFANVEEEWTPLQPISQWNDSQHSN